MRTFSVTTLGCKVNQYESEQLAVLLRSRGLTQVSETESADLRVVNTCSVTVQAASKSRQTIRQAGRRRVELPVLGNSATAAGERQTPAGGRVLVTGCWATGDRDEASRLRGVSAVVTHHDDAAAEIDRLLILWQSEDQRPPAERHEHVNRSTLTHGEPPEPAGDDGWITRARTQAASSSAHNKSQSPFPVKRNLAGKLASAARPADVVGTRTLPLLEGRQEAHQRAFLKVQDGCDAHCTYCIIPRLRPGVWSKPVEAVVEEARRMVEAGHREIVLTGIFLGAYGQETALRRRQQEGGAGPLGRLVEALCTQVGGLRRLRLSSLEPGDLGGVLLRVLRSHRQVVPHFHLPLQSGSDLLLRRMNRQYTRDEYLRMVERLHAAYDRPAITTDIIVGFPGETEQEFGQTLDVVRRVKFIHVHAFSFSPRPGTAAARWANDFVRGPVVDRRIDVLRAESAAFSEAYRRQFVGDVVEILVERPEEGALHAGLQRGRCERYFSVHFEHAEELTGRAARVRITRVTPQRTFGALEEAGT